MPFDLSADRLHLEPRDCLILAGLLGAAGIGAAVLAVHQAHAEQQAAMGGRRVAGELQQPALPPPQRGR